MIMRAVAAAVVVGRGTMVGIATTTRRGVPKQIGHVLLVPKNSRPFANHAVDQLHNVLFATTVGTAFSRPLGCLVRQAKGPVFEREREREREMERRGLVRLTRSSEMMKGETDENLKRSESEELQAE
jgi:hypothetical protein